MKNKSSKSGKSKAVVKTSQTVADVYNSKNTQKVVKVDLSLADLATKKYQRY